MHIRIKRLLHRAEALHVVQDAVVHQEQVAHAVVGRQDLVHHPRRDDQHLPGHQDAGPAAYDDGITVPDRHDQFIGTVPVGRIVIGLGIFIDAHRVVPVMIDLAQAGKAVLFPHVLFRPFPRSLDPFHRKAHALQQAEDAVVAVKVGAADGSHHSAAG